MGNNSAKIHMKIGCHFAIPRPPYPELDAVLQDGLKIVQEIGGEMNHLYPGRTARPYFPRFLCGFQQISKLVRMDRAVDIHHVFSNGFYPYPILLLFNKPVIFSTVIGISKGIPAIFSGIMGKVKTFTVPGDGDLDIMRSCGNKNVEVVYSGIDLNRISYTPNYCTSKFVLLFGSAPWNQQQFEKKGVDLVLQAMRELPWLHVVFLWRGLLLEDIKKRVQKAGVDQRVIIINEKTDVNRILAEVHASIVLAAKSSLVKSYPHSLLESLAAGKPVLVSKCLELAEFVSKEKCGEVVDRLSLDELVSKLKRVRRQGVFLQEKVSRLDLSTFSSEGMLERYKMLYNTILS